MFVLSRGVVQAMATGRDANGLTNQRHPSRTNVFMPKLDDYGVPWSVKEGRKFGKAWTVCVVPDGTVIPAAAVADPDIFVIDEAKDTVLSGGRRNAVNNKLAQTDLGVTAVAGDTVVTLVNKILVALGQDASADASRL